MIGSGALSAGEAVRLRHDTLLSEIDRAIGRSGNNRKQSRPLGPSAARAQSYELADNLAFFGVDY